MENNPENPLLFQFYNEIGIIDQLARARLEGVLPDDLKISQFAVLNHLVRLGGDWSPVRLAKALQVTKGAMTNTLQRLESKNLIQIEPDPDDRRAKVVTLAQAGENMREQCIQNIVPIFANLEKECGSELLMNTLPALQIVREYLDENR